MNKFIVTVVLLMIPFTNIMAENYYPEGFHPEDEGLSWPSHSVLQEGDICDPNINKPESGMGCVPHFRENGGALWVIDQPQVLNAEKGNILLSKGCGMIGSILDNVDPPQSYSHAGIMTENRYRVRHSTMATDRLNAYYANNDPTDGFQERALKFGWPGTITETAGEAFSGSYHEDPRDGRKYVIENSFYPFLTKPELESKVAGGEEQYSCLLTEEKLVSPLVVNYPELNISAFEQSAPSDAVKKAREHQQRIADAAMSIHGHYRLHQYSNAAIQDEEAVSIDDVGWGPAQETVPTVCSTFIHKAAKKTNITLDTVTRIDDTTQPPHPANEYGLNENAILDGLYHYSESERKAAAQGMRDFIFLDVFIKGSESFGKSVYVNYDNTAEEFANQITNCFISDDCNSIKSTAWGNPGIGVSVSPDDILSWDAPYGYSERLQFSHGEPIRIHSWQPVDGTGTIFGTVLNDMQKGERVYDKYGEVQGLGTPVSDALVLLSGRVLKDKITGKPALTSEVGEFEFADVPIQKGKAMEIRAYSYDRKFCSHLKEVSLPLGDSLNMSLLLDTTQCDTVNGMMKSDREIRVEYQGTTTDYEWWPAKNEFDNFNGQQVIHIGPKADIEGNSGKDFKHFLLDKEADCVGDEVAPEVSLEIRSQDPSSGGIIVDVHGKLYEGTSCDLSESDVDVTNKILNLAILPGDAVIRVFNMYSEGDRDYDRLEMTIKILNCRRSDPEGICTP